MSDVPEVAAAAAAPPFGALLLGAIESGSSTVMVVGGQDKELTSGDKAMQIVLSIKNNEDDD